MTGKFYLESDIREIAVRVGPLVQQLSGRTVLFTGAGGFIGTHFMALFDFLNCEVLARPIRVIALDNFIASTSDLAELTNFTSIDFRSHNVIRPLAVDEKIDFILHAAGIASPVRYRTDPLATLDASTLGTRNMLELARLHGASLLFFSSSEIYGNPDPNHVPTSENYPGMVSCIGPRSCYDEGKRVGETMCDIYHKYMGLRTIVVRPFNVFGPGLGERDYRVLPNFAARIKAAAPLEVYGSGKQTRTFCYVVDAVVGFLLALIKGVPGEAYNIGNPTPELTMEDLAQRVQRLLGNGVTYQLVDYPDGYPGNEPQRRCPTIQKARLHLAFEPTVDLDDGLRRFFAWAESAYQGVNLPGSQPIVPLRAVS